jgi:hypothetical protein
LIHTGVNVAVGLMIASLPCLMSGLFSAAELPPILAYLLFPGRDLLFLLGGLVVLWAVFRDRVPTERVSRKLESLSSHRAFAPVAFALVAMLAFVRVPQPEKEADAFGGDEPKYLRIAFSLLRDTNADLSGGRTATPDLATRLQQVRNLVLVGRDSFLDLFRPVVIPNDHVWDAGNWTVRGLDGGLYHLQPPGLPALVAVALGIGEAILPARDPGIYVFVLLSVIWILATRQLWLLSQDISGDALGSTVFVGLVILSAPVFVGGYQLFPESLSLLLFPWLFRRLRGSDRPLRPASALFCGLLAGYMLWIHPKLTVVAALFAVMGLLRPLTSVRAKAAFAAGFVLTALTALVYCHHISGLFRPEGLYIRQAEEYVGSPNPLSLRFGAGLVKSLIGGRDGLFLFAPILILGFVALRGMKRPSRSTFEMWALFAAVWLTSAVHDGASLGSPARLMMPVVFVPAWTLARALRSRAPAGFAVAAVLLFLVGNQITGTMVSDWRRNVNPYRTMFAQPATNFEPSLPGNSFTNEAYIVDLEKAGLILLVFVIAAALLNRSSPSADPLAPARFGVGVLGVIITLAFGLNWLGPT